MGRKRQERAVRQERPPHVIGSDHRAPSMLASSPATLRVHEQRRGQPLLVPSTIKRFGMVTLGGDDRDDLLIDTRYQRDEVTTEVNDLIHVLKRGGFIPDPISVAERKYGDRKQYIVDGQQRWWAHVDTDTPVAAVIYHVHSFEEEVALFHAFNTQTRVSPENRLRSMPGPMGDTIRKLNEDASSPLYGKISYNDKGSKFGAMIVARALAALVSNTKITGGLDRVQPTFDRYYRIDPKSAERLIASFAWLIAQVFEEQRLRSVTGVALARMVYAAFVNHGGEMPNAVQLRRLKTVKWDRLTPTSAIQWLPTVVAAVQDIWPVQMVQETKAEK